MPNLGIEAMAIEKRRQRESTAMATGEMLLQNSQLVNRELIRRFKFEAAMLGSIAASRDPRIYEADTYENGDVKLIDTLKRECYERWLNH